MCLKDMNSYVGMTMVKKQGQDYYYALVGRASVAYAYLPTFQNWLPGHMTTSTNL